MATFHPFPRLPIELRTQIWALATEDRVLRVRKARYGEQHYWSPTPVPAVTRACRESRQNCSYQKAFMVIASLRYIWANFDRDVIEMMSYLLQPEENIGEREEIRSLRIDLVDEYGFNMWEHFSLDSSHKLHLFPRLERFDLLVGGGLAYSWTAFIKMRSWGVCPRGNVRIVDRKTGEYITEETSDLYQDYIDSREREYEIYPTIVDEEEEERERAEAMKRLQIPLPRIDMDY